MLTLTAVSSSAVVATGATGSATPTGWLVGNASYWDPNHAVFTLTQQLQQLPRYQFKMQFTSAEFAAITAAMTPPASPTSAQVTLAQELSFFFEILNDTALLTIDLTSAFTIQGVELLESSGLIATGRADTVLAGVQISIT